MVKDHPELDFQTGSNKNNSWFSVYRGTSKIIKIEKSGKSKISYEKKYYDLCPEYYKDTTKSVHLNTLLDKLKADPNLSRYYGNESTGKKAEGYYQNLIARRYTFLNKPDDDFIIIDKEFVIGIRNEVTKKRILDKNRCRAQKSSRKRVQAVIEEPEEECGDCDTLNVPSISLSNVPGVSE